MNRDADTYSNATYITQSSSNYPQTELKTGAEDFKGTRVVFLEVARCQEEGHQFMLGDSRDVHRVSNGQGQK